MRLLFILSLSLLCPSIYAAEDLLDIAIDRAFERIIRAMQKQEDEKAGKKQEEEQIPAGQITFQETQHQFDDALKEKNIPLAETLEHRLALLGYVDWEYLNKEKRDECCWRLKDAAENLNKQDGAPIVDYQEKGLAVHNNEATRETALWLKDRIMEKRCQNLKWSEIVNHLDERFEGCLIPRGEWEYEDFKVTDEINANRIKKLNNIIGIQETATQPSHEGIQKDPQ